MKRWAVFAFMAVLLVVAGARTVVAQTTAIADTANKSVTTNQRLWEESSSKTSPTLLGHRPFAAT